MLNKKHVLVIVRHPVGGIRTHLSYVLSSSAFYDYNFMFLLPEVDESRILAEVMEDKRVSFTYVNDKSAFRSLLVATIKLVRSGKYSLVHSHGFTSGVLASYVAKWFRIPHLLTVHDVLREDQFIGWKGKLKRRMLELSLREIDVIHSVTDDAQENLRQFVFSTRKAKQMVMIPNGVDVSRFTGAPTRNLREELGVGGQTVIAAFFGRFMSQKGFDVIVRAVHQLAKEGVTPDDFIIVVTRGDGFYREEMEVVRQASIQEYFKVIRYEKNIAPALKGTDVLLMPSRWEAAGVLAMEAMCVGVPVIGTNSIGLREVLKGTPSVIIDVGDAGALAQAIKTFLESESRAAAYQFTSDAINRFSAERTIEGVSEIYKSLVRM